MEDIWIATSQQEKLKLAIEKIVAGEWFPRYMMILKKYGIMEEKDDMVILVKEKVGDCLDVAHNDILFAECMSKKFPEVQDDLNKFFEEMDTEVQRRIDTMIGQESMFIGG